MPFRRHRKHYLALFALCALHIGPTEAEPTLTVLPEGRLLFSGDTARFSLGYISGGHFQGELAGLIHESPTASLLGEAWVSRAAGGAKISFHQMADGIVTKYFVAHDQNQTRDRKLTFGYGLERENWFGNLNVSRGLTDRRLMDQRNQVSTSQESGNVGDIPYLDTITRTNTVRIYEKAYDLGIGLRAGHYFGATDTRVTAGLDYEWGRNNARQTTLSLSTEKAFVGTPHSIGLQLDFAQKSGVAEVNRRNARFTVQYRYSFGATPNFRPQQLYRLVPVKRSGVISKAEPAESIVIPARIEKRWVKSKATMTGDAFFEFDSARLTPVAMSQLDRVAVRLKAGGREGNVRIVGHTCDIGSDKINDRLSLKRALSVRDYLVAQHALSDDEVYVEGRGKREPAYPVTPSTREKNRRVELEFFRQIDLEESYEIPERIVPGKPVAPQETEITFVREYVDQPSAWAQRAMRTAAVHKRAVDVYRSKEESTVETRSREFINRAPSARDDSFDVVGGTPTGLAVLSNDSDPDAGDSLSIASVTASSIGQLRIDGRQIIYTSPVNYSGQDRFSYTVRDSQGLSSMANVIVTIRAPNQAPLARDDTYTVGSLPATLNVLANDSDPDGDPISIISVTAPTGNVGKLEVAGTQLVFTMSERFLMSTFTYTVSDGKGGQASALVTLIDP